MATDRGVEVVRGHLLSQASSRRHRHLHPPAAGYAAPGERCSACRWTRVTILYEAGAERPYVIVSEGLSIVRGEHPLGKVERTSSPLWVIEWLHRRNHRRELFLPIVARQALLIAAERDEALGSEVRTRLLG